MADEVLLTVREAARRLGIGRSLLYRLMVERQLLSVKIGRSRRIRVWALEEFAKAKVAEAEAADLPLEALPLER
ncbi:MAG TPA: helix-turn-helix domain-containing protein [Dehalococcoidia bacterium]|nr:helix-turn-helix domain-containing protein [Dehalococcoidia bacterium]